MAQLIQAASDHLTDTIRRELLSHMIKRHGIGATACDEAEQAFDAILNELQQLSDNYKSPGAITLFSSIFFNRCQNELTRLLQAAQVPDPMTHAAAVVDCYKRKADFRNESSMFFRAVAEAV